VEYPSIRQLDAQGRQRLLGGALPGDSWRPWRTLLIAANGEALTDDERALFTELTGREHEPLQRVDEVAAVVGRRGGKSRAMAVEATYIAGLCDHTDALAPGEKGVLLCIALDQRVVRTSWLTGTRRRATRIPTSRSSTRSRRDWPPPAAP
jgi:hypothetical protein